MEWILLKGVVLFTLLGLLAWRTGTIRFALWALGVIVSLGLAGWLLFELFSRSTRSSIRPELTDINPEVFVGVLVGVGALVIALTLMVYRRRARTRALVGLLALAVEKGMPLPAVVQAFAADQPFVWRRKLADLATRLSYGLPLSVAARLDGGTLSREAIAAAQVGEATGDLPGAFRLLEASDSVRNPARQTLIGNIFYLLWPVLFVPLIVIFFMLAVMPKFIAIYDDFGVELPRISVIVVQLIYATPTLVALATVFIGVPALLIYGALCYTGVAPPLRVGLGRRFERGRTLRALALAIGGSRPLSETLLALGRTYPNPSVGRRLEACGADVAAGDNWIASLSKHGLIGRRDVAVVESAQRVGNLPWALCELAHSHQRRLIYRLETALNIISPLVLLGWGAAILVIAVAFFLPLVKMITDLS